MKRFNGDILHLGAALVAFIAIYGASALASPVAFLVNGGSGPIGNRCDFVQDVDRAHLLLGGWDRSNLYADGGGPQGPVNSELCDSKMESVRDETMRPMLTRSRPKTGVTGSATFANFRESVLNNAMRARNGEPILLYFTDHGGRDGKGREHTVAMWGQDMSVSQLREVLGDLRKLRPDSNVVLVHDHCFGGGMLEAIMEPMSGGAQPMKRMCGFSPASGAEYAFDGESYMRSAHDLFHTASAPKSSTLGTADMDGDGSFSFGEIHRQILLARTTSSTPTSTSDIFLQKYFDTHRGKAGPGGRDQLLAACIFQREPVNEIFAGLQGTLNPSLNSLLESRIESIRADLGQYYAGAGVNEGASYASIEKYYADQIKALRDLEQKEQALRAHMLPALYGYVRKRLDQTYGPEAVKAMLAARDEIGNIRDEIASPGTSSARRAELETKLEEMRAKKLETKIGFLPMEHLQVQVKREMVSGRPGNAEFRDYMRERGLSPNEFAALAKSDPEAAKKAWTYDTQEQHTAAQKAFEDANERLQPIRRLMNAVRSADALDKMRGDPDALAQYLGIIQCENTPMGKVPGSS